MDLLEKYKETWKNQPEDTQTVSKEEIYKLSLKKSTSIVKWILIIGIAEFLFLFFLGLIISDDKDDNLPIILEYCSIILSIISYIGVFYYLYHFYKNYKKISVVANTKGLMENILTTRKTVKNYIKFNISIFAIGMLLILPFMLYGEYLEKGSAVAVGMAFFMIPVFVILYYLYKGFYHLLYGWLLDKLYYNHKELMTIEELE